jgi:hypothetical protein
MPNLNPLLVLSIYKRREKARNFFYVAHCTSASASDYHCIDSSHDLTKLHQTHALVDN